MPILEKILAIETSCDETAASVWIDGRGIASNVVFSQVKLHAVYGGVVPEIASRSHLEKIGFIVQSALDQAGCSLSDLTTIAVTTRPGLPGSLLVGLCYAKALAACAKKRIIGIDHIQAHIFSACIENAVTYPHLCLMASGGNTALYMVHGLDSYQVLASTLDDAAGEALDKVAKLIGLPYPGGPEIERLAAQVAYKDFFAYPRSMPGSLELSFSGLKTAVLYDVIKRGWYDVDCKLFLKADDETIKAQIASSLLVCIAETFTQKVRQALKQYPEARAVTFVGGVACNTYLKQVLERCAREREVFFFAPSPQYATDNAAMVAYIAQHKAHTDQFDTLALDIAF